MTPANGGLNMALNSRQDIPLHQRRLHTGLVSVTFRALSAQEVVTTACRAGLEGIEWGGDVHVPHGDLSVAREVHAMTNDAGLSVVSYGSYYRAGSSEQEGLPFERVLQTAIALGAPTIRVWAGNQASAQGDAAFRDRVDQDTRRVASLAAGAGIDIAFEYHGGTLTDTCQSTLDLIERVKAPNLRQYWQPALGLSPQQRLRDLRRILPHLSHAHAFFWHDHGGTIDRRPLAEGEDEWRSYLGLIRGDDRPHFVLLEFVRDDSVPQFQHDAATLLRWLEAC